MELTQFFKSVIDMDKSAVVICNLEHEIIYMNPAAEKRYARRWGKNLVGKNLLDCHKEESQQKIKNVVLWFGKNPENNIVYTAHNKKENKDVYIVALRDSDKKLIGYYEKHEYRNSEVMNMYDLN